MNRASGRALGTALAALLLVGLFGTRAQADEGGSAPDVVWLRGPGGRAAPVDLSGLDAEVRAEVLRTLERRGFTRVGPERGGQPARDVAADVRALVAGGGRLPRPEPAPASAEAAGTADAPALAALGRLLLDVADAALRPGRLAPLVPRLRRAARALLRGEIPLEVEAPAPVCAAPPPAEGQRVLGARVAWEASAGGERPVLRVLEVPSGSLAAEAGFEPGDSILALDGAPLGPSTLTRLCAADRAPGQLEVRLRRRDGRIQTWALELLPLGPTQPAPREE